jgi:hypothetical protein
MSAQLDFNDGAEAFVQNSLDLLAPKMQERVTAALWECNNVAGLGVVVYESVRDDHLQQMYYARGRTTVPPHHTVTNAKTAMGGWHFYGLAVDVIHEKRRWNNPESWWLKVSAIFKAHGLDWGGDWTVVDLPHFQFAGLRKSPSPRARELYAAGGNKAVWKAVGAI